MKESWKINIMMVNLSDSNKREGEDRKKEDMYNVEEVLKRIAPGST